MLMLNKPLAVSGYPAVVRRDEINLDAEVPFDNGEALEACDRLERIRNLEHLVPIPEFISWPSQYAAIVQQTTEVN